MRHQPEDAVNDHTIDTGTVTGTTVFVHVEGMLWNPAPLWNAAVDAIAARFARLAALDVDAVHVPAAAPAASDALGDAVTTLVGWADANGVDAGRELRRFFDEHLPLHVRPDRHANQRLRSLASAGHAVIACSALPPAPLESLLGHIGVARALSGTVADLRSADDLEGLTATSGGAALTVVTASPVLATAIRGLTTVVHVISGLDAVA